MSINGSRWRNVSFHDAANPEEALGGFVQNGSITEANFLDILGIMLVVGESPLRVQERISSCVVSRTDVPLTTGVYDIYCEVHDELWMRRAISHNITGRDRAFRHRISNRDRKCLISGLVNPESNIQSLDWSGYEAAHIFPLEHESHWVQFNYSRWMTDMHDAAGSSKINSSQNGLLLQSDLHNVFDLYLLSVNPDDGYKVVVFTTDRLGLDGRILDPVCRSPTNPH
ncbi:unnamed protein product, partial [Tuber aestivum]